jgi:hypothetical protein
MALELKDFVLDFSGLKCEPVLEEQCGVKHPLGFSTALTLLGTEPLKTRNELLRKLYASAREQTTARMETGSINHAKQNNSGQLGTSREDAYRNLVESTTKDLGEITRKALAEAYPAPLKTFSDVLKRHPGTTGVTEIMYPDGSVRRTLHQSIGGSIEYLFKTDGTIEQVKQTALITAPQVINASGGTGAGSVVGTALTGAKPGETFAFTIGGDGKHAAAPAVVEKIDVKIQLTESEGERIMRITREMAGG